MRKALRFTSKQLGRFVPAKALFKLATPPFLPFYHVVSDQKLAHIHNYPFRTVRQFQFELEFFLKHFKPVSLQYLIENPKTTEKIFHISFDDGLKECAEIVAPILFKKGIPATFFINPGFIDNQKLFHRYKASLIVSELQRNPDNNIHEKLKNKGTDCRKILRTEHSQEWFLDELAEDLGIDFNRFLENQKPYLTTEQVLKLKNQGFSIGAHSFDHPEFWTLSKEEQLQQMVKSTDWVTEKIQPGIRAFAFPFTDSGVAPEVLQAIHEKKICDVTFGTAGLKYDGFPFHFQRYPVEMPGNFVQNIKSEWIYFLLRKWVGKETVKH
jgi:peptidoglycan/xylan/chitin deacetylase (PgdA/CDA1 family)